MKKFKRLLSVLLIVSFSGVSMVQNVQAAMVSTEQVAQAAAVQQAGDSHARLNDMLARTEVQAELQRYGLTEDQARERIAALTDEEAAALVKQVDDAPAGGIIGAILLVFFVLLLTDILGLTKVFPFTRSIR
ncbi:PA2779 family protein [Thauera sp. 2A1]|uniref:PA2779 family protein n=1 Tax=Thauera sp. 2A1 TaxID=2570191 RepID=UPI001292872F|nr:PA2779 family protein [Thauera sp. 2A1]KAI5913139.1 PA2779 family protein [Thauera sp. 2A1]